MQLPGPLRAAVGLAATAAAEAKHLPDRAIELPMIAVSTALQMSLRLQQRYAKLADRGDAVLRGRKVSDDPPPWATFDDTIGDFPSSGASPGDTAQASALLRDLFGTDEPRLNGRTLEVAPDADDEGPDAPQTPPASAAERSEPRRFAPRKTAARNSAARNTATPSTTAVPRKTAESSKTAAPSNTAAKRPSTGKAVRKPRSTAPSKFDAVEDD